MGRILVSRRENFIEQMKGLFREEKKKGSVKSKHGVLRIPITVNHPSEKRAAADRNGRYLSF